MMPKIWYCLSMETDWKEDACFTSYRQWKQTGKQKCVLRAIGNGNRLESRCVFYELQAMTAIRAAKVGEEGSVIRI